jgi:nucleoside-diphosphate-sugar epimerase
MGKNGWGALCLGSVGKRALLKPTIIRVILVSVIFLCVGFSFQKKLANCHWFRIKHSLQLFFQVFNVYSWFMQTILGYKGAIGKSLALALKKYTRNVRLVSREPAAGDANLGELMAANLLSEQGTADAVAGSSVVYLTVGLPYQTKIWEAQWPVLMRNVLRACERHEAKLVFFDNVYMYGKVAGAMTEATPFRPVSRIGEVRAGIALEMLEAMAKGKINGLIARSADFYGPGVQHSYLCQMVIKRLKEGKKAQLMANRHTLHSYTYTPDAAYATVLLGNTPEAFQQTWHLPTDPDTLTGEGMVQLVASVLKVKPRATVLPTWSLALLSPFVPMVRENMEMLYQNQYDYVFDSQKFLNAFPAFTYTPYEEGVRETVFYR